MQKKHFGDWIIHLPYRHYKLMKKAIMDECVINYSIWYNWKTGNTKIPQGYWKRIDYIAREYEIQHGNLEFEGLIYSPVFKPLETVSA